MRPCVFGTCMWICSCVACRWTLLMKAILAISITCSIMILFYVQMSLEYVRLQALHGFLETNAHIYITAVTLVYWLRMSSWRFNIGCMSWDLFLNFIFVLAISNCSFMPSIKVLEAHAHMVFLVLCFDLSDCIFVINICSYTMWVSQLLTIAARLEPYAVTTVSHCILIFHSVSTFSVLVRYKKI